MPYSLEMFSRSLPRPTKVLAWLVAVFCLLCSSVYGADSDDYIIERGYLKDVELSAGVQTLAQSAFHPFSGVLALGYVESASWIKLRIRPREPGQRLVLTIRPAFLDHIRLYQPDPNVAGGWLEQNSGEMVSWLDRSCPGVLFCFEVKPEQETDYYLRVVTSSTSLFDVIALTPQATTLASFRMNAWSVLYCLFMSWILMWALFDFWSHRQSVVGWFAVTQTCWILYCLVLFGYWPLIFPSASQTNLLTQCLIVGAVNTQILFNHQFLAPFKPPKLLLLLLKFMVALGVGLWLALLLGFQVQAVVRINPLNMLISGLIILPTAWMATQDDVLTKNALRMPYLIKTLVIVVVMVPILWGDGQDSDFSLNGVLVIGTASAILLAYLLFRRSLKFRAVAAQLSFQRARWAEQSLMLSMLSHELKTPLSVLRSVLGIKRMTPELLKLGVDSIHEMDQIIEKSREANRLESDDMQIHAEDCDLVQLLEQITTRESGRSQLRASSPSIVIRTDVSLLRIILKNLIENAEKYGDPLWPVEISIDRIAGARDGVQVMVTNHIGEAGLPDPDHMFGKYRRGARAHRFSGSGLGLYLAHGFSQRLGAQLHYVPSEQQVCFKLVLPVLMPMKGSV